MTIDQVNDALDIVLPEGEEFETIAGFAFKLAGRLVEQGEEFTYENVSLRADHVEDTRAESSGRVWIGLVTRASVDRSRDDAEPDPPPAEPTRTDITRPCGSFRRSQPQLLQQRSKRYLTSGEAFPMESSPAVTVGPHCVTAGVVPEKPCFDAEPSSRHSRSSSS